MRDVDSATQAALEARALVARNFIYLTAPSFEDGTPESIGFWDDLGEVTVTVVSGETLSEESRVYIGTGTLLSVDDVPLTSDVSIRTVSATLSQIDQAVADAVRGYDLHQAPVEIHRGLFDPETRLLVAPPLPRFVGFVDKCILTDPREGQEGSIALTLSSHTQELTRASTEKCSDESQKRRAAGDAFYSDVATVGSWTMFWGQYSSDQKTSIETQVRAKGWPFKNFRL